MRVKPSTIVWMVLWVIAAFGLYMVKYKVKEIRAEVASTEKLLREDKKNLHVLTAEWTYLNRPERLKELSAKYLHMIPATGRQIGDFASLGEVKPAGSATPAADTDGGAPLPRNRVTLAGGTDHVR